MSKIKGVYLLVGALFIIGGFTVTLAEEITTTASYSGLINGQAFSGTGTGSSNTLTGMSQGSATFTGIPPSYSMMEYGKSWKCKHHKCIAVEVEGAVNLFTLTDGNYDEDLTVTYPNGDVLTVHAEVRRNGNNQHLDFTMNGNYSGPTDIVAVEGAVEGGEATWYPAGPGQMTTYEVETLVRANGERFNIVKTSTVTFSNPDAVLPSEQTLSVIPSVYTVISQGNTVQLTLNTMSVVRPR